MLSISSEARDKIIAQVDSVSNILTKEYHGVGLDTIKQVINSIPVDDTPTFNETKEYCDKRFPSSCAGCKLENMICEHYDCRKWNIEIISKIIKEEVK